MTFTLQVLSNRLPEKITDDKTSDKPACDDVLIPRNAR